MADCTIDDGLSPMLIKITTSEDKVDFNMPHKSQVEIIRSQDAFDKLQKRNVVVNVTIIKLGEINTLKECFAADVLVLSRWREPSLDYSVRQVSTGVAEVDLKSIWNPKLFIENTVGDVSIRSSLFLEYHNNEEAYVIERKRFKGIFMENLELFDFPFDVQDITVNIMSELSCEEIVLAECSQLGDRHRILKQPFIDEQEWYLYKYIESEIVEKSHDEVNPSVIRSYISVRAKVARRSAFYLWNIFSITFLITCLAFVTFAVDSKLPHRITMTFTLILTSVAFKFTVNQTLPRIPYLTYLDRYILTNMFMLTMVAMWHGVQAAVQWDSRQDYYALIGFASFYALFNVIFILTVFFKPLSTRRKMKKNEREYLERMKHQSEQNSRRNPFFNADRFFSRARRMFRT